MTEEKAFEPITTQAEFDTRIKARLQREREKWEKGSEVEELRAQLQAREEELAAANEATEQVKRDWYRREAERALEQSLIESGHTDPGKNARILRHVDFDLIEPDESGEPHRARVVRALAEVQKDMPELFAEGCVNYHSNVPRGKSDKPVLKSEAPLTHEELEAMSESEINSRWDQIKAFMAGERG
jgi:hypothetical protein